DLRVVAERRDDDLGGGSAFAVDRQLGRMNLGAVEKGAADAVAEICGSAAGGLVQLDHVVLEKVHQHRIAVEAVDRREIHLALAAQELDSDVLAALLV